MRLQDAVAGSVVREAQVGAIVQGDLAHLAVGRPGDLVAYGVPILIGKLSDGVVSVLVGLFWPP
jgi:hypothetical protein